MTLAKSLGVGLIVTLIGCGPDQNLTELKRYINQVKRTVSKPEGRVPQKRQQESYTYSTQELRDPFISPFILSQEKSGQNSDSERVPEPLEKFALSTLEIVGSVEISGKQWALVRAPDDSVHHVTIGSYMGKNRGKVERVTAKYIDLIERNLNHKTKEWKELPMKLMLRKNKKQGTICTHVTETEELCIN